MTPDKYYTTLHLRSLHVSANIGLDAWGRPSRPQPLILSLSLIIDTTSAGPPDTLTNTFSYGQLAKDITSKISNGDFLSIDHLTSDLAGLADSWPGETLKLDILAPKALLLVEDGFGREIVLRRREVKTGEFRQLVWHVVSHEWFVRGLKCTCIIGMNPGERLEKQGVVIGLRIRGEKEKEDYAAQIREGPEMWRRLVREVCEVVEPSNFQTLEALAALVARICLESFPMPQVTVSIDKPNALTFVDGAGVEIMRDRRWLSMR